MFALGNPTATQVCSCPHPPASSCTAKVLDDVLSLAEREEEALLRAHAPHSRAVSLDAATRLRVACLRLLCGFMRLDSFREHELLGQVR